LLTIPTRYNLTSQFVDWIKSEIIFGVGICCELGKVDLVAE